MTREEAARIIKKCKDKGFKHTFYTLTEYHTALDMAIQALEQTELKSSYNSIKTELDLISRQAVLDLPRIKTYNEWGIIIKESVDIKNVRQLPSVSTEKTGRWIDGTDCSCCGFAFYDDVIDSKLLVGFKYCPNCCAKMCEDGE